MNPGMTNNIVQPNGTMPAPQINWQAVQQKMAQLQTATQQGVINTTEDKIALLKSRAKTLAHVPEETAATGLQLEVAEFCLGEGTYALPSTAVREVYPLRGLTPLPCTPAFVLGVINVRGRILPIIDLAFLLGLSTQQISEQSTVVFMRWQDLEVGIVTNAGVTIRSLPLTTIHPPLSTFTTSHARYLQGITNEGVVVLDAAKLLTGVRLGSHEG